MTMVARLQTVRSSFTDWGQETTMEMEHWAETPVAGGVDSLGPRLCYAYTSTAGLAFELNCGSLPSRLQAVDANGTLCQSRDSETVPQSLLGIVDVVVADRGVCRDTIVPECNCAILPLNTRLEVLALGNVLYTVSSCPK